MTHRLAFLALLGVLALSACGTGEDAEPAPATGEDAPTALPDVARIVCEPAGTRVETPSVKPQADGIHLEIVNETGGERSFSILDDRGGGTGQGAPVGVSTLVVDLAPGVLEVACTDPAADVQQGSPLDVVDEDGVFVDAVPDCPQVAHAVIDYIRGADGEPTPEQAVRKHAAGQLEAGDELAEAGYPQAPSPLVRLDRGGTTIAVFQLAGDDAGGWLVDGVSSCPPYGGGAG